MSQLIDRYGRTLNYLRLSVTDRCNFRCYYCMPEEGTDFAPKSTLLSFEEMLRLCRLFTTLGVSKIRITGGEPFVRKGLMPFLQELSATPGLEEITITTNGTLIAPHLPQLLDVGIRKINLSLDSLSRERFFQITRRDAFNEVLNLIYTMVDAGMDVKLNCVVLSGKNTDDILPFVALTQTLPIAVRFLEEMPFNGGDHAHTSTWDHTDILTHIRQQHPQLEPVASAPESTSVNYRIPGYKGSFGIIPAFSRTFCGTCNRIRLSATGALRTCLYGPAVVNLRDLLRTDVPEEKLVTAIENAIAARERDGRAAEQANAAVHNSMALLGG
ncbi:MAG: GTP 3',8-cyclase MoaA [Sphingobacteriales bacterium]|nr:MAG: GTP 3',8-cyclase MoaA [Sphingobacteriales bacterium]